MHYVSAAAQSLKGLAMKPTVEIDDLRLVRDV
jgi:hypothetical protein